MSTSFDNSLSGTGSSKTTFLDTTYEDLTFRGHTVSSEDLRDELIHGCNHEAGDEACPWVRFNQLQRAIDAAMDETDDDLDSITATWSEIDQAVEEVCSHPVKRVRWNDSEDSYSANSSQSSTGKSARRASFATFDDGTTLSFDQWSKRYVDVDKTATPHADLWDIYLDDLDRFCSWKYGQADDKERYPLAGWIQSVSDADM